MGEWGEKFFAIFRATLELNRQRWDFKMGGAKNLWA
jgi:hypothetical protein